MHSSEKKPEPASHQQFADWRVYAAAATASLAMAATANASIIYSSSHYLTASACKEFLAAHEARTGTSLHPAAEEDHCWLGGRDKHRVFFIVMVDKQKRTQKLKRPAKQTVELRKKRLVIDPFGLVAASINIYPSDISS